MLKRFIGLNNLFLFIFAILFQNPINAKIGDKYSCKDYANTYYERGSKFNRDNYNFFLQWEKNKIFKESDRLGGIDPYSGSKACAEIVINTYYKSFFGKKKGF